MVETNFKHTDIGIIPHDWKVIELGEIGEPLMCKRVLKDQTKLSGDVPFYKIGTFGGTPDAYISRSLFEELKSKYNYPQKGDILISAAGTIGRTIVFDGNDAYFQDSNIVWIDNNGEKVTNFFLKICLGSIKWATTDGGTIKRLYNNNIKQSKIVVPTNKDEQTHIATALNDIDDLIQELQALVIKKKNIKIGVMQQLLSGGKRLKGFTDNWEKVTVYDIVGNISRGQTLKSDDFIEGNVPVMAGGRQYAGYHNKANQKGRTITLSGSGASAGFVAIHKMPIFATDCSVIAEKDGFSLDFLYYILSYRQEDLYKLQTGGAQPHVYPRDIEKLEITIPTSPIEQQAIAKVLADMDEEIDMLNARLEKYKYLRDGMMQQLLTGKIRLI